MAGLVWVQPEHTPEYRILRGREGRNGRCPAASPWPRFFTNL